MSHANAPLTPRGRLRLARCVVDDGWPLRRAAERFEVSRDHRAKRWADRYREHGAAGMVDRSSRPHRSPRRTADADRTADHRAAGDPPLGAGPDRATGWGCTPPRCTRCCAATAAPRWPGPTRPPAPGCAAGPRRRATSTSARATWSTSTSRSSAGSPTAAATGSTAARSPATDKKPRHARLRATCTHAIDDHSRLAYSEILADERKETAAAFWTRATGLLRRPRDHRQRVLTDNGSCYRSKLLRRRARRARSRTSGPGPTGPRPTARSNGSTAPCSRNGPTPAPYASEAERVAAFPDWLHTLQSSPRPHRTRRSTARRPRHQPRGQYS